MKMIVRKTYVSYNWGTAEGVRMQCPMMKFDF